VYIKQRTEFHRIVYTVNRYIICCVRFIKYNYSEFYIQGNRSIFIYVLSLVAYVNGEHMN